MWPNPQFNANLVTHSEVILNWKLQFFCAVKEAVPEAKMTQKWDLGLLSLTFWMKRSGNGWNKAVQSKALKIPLSPVFGKSCIKWLVI